jgi:hypothetical protein
MNGKRACGPQALEKLLEIMPEGHRVHLLMLWLQDQVPTKHKGLLHITPAAETAMDEESVDIGTFEGTMAFLNIVAGKNDSVRALLMFLASQHSTQDT